MTDALQKELVHDGKFCSRLVLHSQHFAYSFNMHAILMHMFLSGPLSRLNLEYDQNKYRPSFTRRPLHTAEMAIAMRAHKTFGWLSSTFCTQSAMCPQAVLSFLERLRFERGIMFLKSQAATSPTSALFVLEGSVFISEIIPCDSVP